MEFSVTEGKLRCRGSTKHGTVIHESTASQARVTGVQSPETPLLLFAFPLRANARETSHLQVVLTVACPRTTSRVAFTKAILPNCELGSLRYFAIECDDLVCKNSEVTCAEPRAKKPKG